MMEIVIKITEEDYERVKKKFQMSMNIMANAIAHGTPLPKHHGRLIDENELIDEIVCEEIEGSYYDVIYAHSVYDAETIIEADKESDNDVKS